MNSSAFALSELNKMSTTQIQSVYDYGLREKYEDLTGCYPEPQRVFVKGQSFFNYSKANAATKWGYALSCFETKTQIVNEIYLGTVSALCIELSRNKYAVNLSESPTYKRLSFIDGEAQEVFTRIMDAVFGKEHEKVPFTRVITVVRNEQQEIALREYLSASEKDSQYAKVKEHYFVQLLDDGTEEEKGEQKRQWTHLNENFESIFKMIDAARFEKEPILIHCIAGKHRSVAILVAYFMDRFELDIKTSFDYIRSKRVCALHQDDSDFTEWLSDRAKERLHSDTILRKVSLI